MSSAVDPEAPPPKYLRDAATGVAVVAGGGANVIMQLARRPVGRGVVESEVESGNLYKRPVKRTRTTLAYLMVAFEGTQAERLAMRREVNRQHAAVRSRESSPVAYNAFDRELQLWVAACLYRGAEDTYRAIWGDLEDEAVEELYRYGKRFGTTLQVPEEMWPADRGALEEWWNKQVELIEMDDETRRLLRGVADLAFLGRLVSVLFGPLNRFLTTGFLPEPFRRELGLSWSDRKQRRFESLLQVLGFVTRALPPIVRRFPLNLVLWDTRRRIRTGKRIV